MKTHPAVLDLFRGHIKTDGISGHIRPFTGLRRPLCSILKRFKRKISEELDEEDRSVQIEPIFQV
jgi:hypothetical protein